MTSGLTAPAAILHDPFVIESIHISPGHNFFGHKGHPPGTHDTHSVPRVECLARQGLRGDRFLDYKPDYRGQVTFFAAEVYESVSHALGVTDRPPAVFRRNILTRGADLNTLIDREFTVQGIHFLGVCECSPCEWMNTAFAPGAEIALKNRGGLRARILTSGWLIVPPPTHPEIPPP